MVFLASYLYQKIAKYVYLITGLAQCIVASASFLAVSYPSLLVFTKNRPGTNKCDYKSDHSRMESLVLLLFANHSASDETTGGFRLVNIIVDVIKFAWLHIIYHLVVSCTAIYLGT